MTAINGAQGQNVEVVIGFEDSFKVQEATPTGYKIPIVSPSFTPSRNKFQSKAMTGSPQPRPLVFGKTGCDGSLRLECSKDSIGPLLMGLLGNHEVYGASGWYDHRFNLDGSMPSMFVEQTHGDIDTPSYLLTEGVYVNSVTLNFTAEGLMEADFALMGAKHTASTSQTVAALNTTDLTGQDPFSYLLVRVMQGGSALGYSTECSITLNRGVTKQVAQDETNEIAFFTSSIASVEGTLTVFFKDITLYNLAMAGTETSIDIFLPCGAGHGLYVQLPTVKFEPPQMSVSGDGAITVPLKFTAYARGSASNIAAEVRSKWFETITVTNGADDSFEMKFDTVSKTADLDTGSNTIENLQSDLQTAIGAAGTVTIERMAGETGGRLVFRSATKGSGGSVQVVNAANSCNTLLGLGDTTLIAGLDAQAIVFTLMNNVSNYTS